MLEGAVIAVTGATGFVGRRTTAMLRTYGARLRILLRDPRKTGEFEIHGDEVVPGTLADDDAVGRLCDGSDVVLNIAGAVTGRTRSNFMLANAEGAGRLAKAAARNGVGRFVHVSSLAAREPELSHYCASKRAGEDAVRAEAGPMSLAIVRPPAIYGPGDKATLSFISQLRNAHAFIPARAKGRLSLVFVDDISESLVDLAGADRATEGMFELSDGKPDGYAWDELAAAASIRNSRHVNVHFLPRPVVWFAGACAAGLNRIAARPGVLSIGKVRELYHRDWVARNDLLQDNCGWKPRVRFAEGYRRTLDWYVSHGWLKPGTEARAQQETARGAGTA